MSILRFAAIAVVAMLLAAGAARADVFNMGGTRNPVTGTWTGFASLETVQVGNPGNAGDTWVMPNGTTGYGAVSYAYSIGTYDVTAAQYCTFLNAVAATDTYGLYNSNMVTTNQGFPGITRSGTSGSYTYSVDAGRANKPVTCVSFWDACRFANWLNNGQPAGVQNASTTEDGAYTLTPTGISKNTVTRNAGATWAVSSENEWYKAAYYDPTLNSGAGGYWLYPTRSNTISGAQANYTESFDGTTDVGAYPFPSYYGTFDQAGNVYDWNDSIIFDYYGSGESYRGVRGGDWFSGDTQWLQADHQGWNYPAFEGDGEGFRISEIPEPSTLSLLALGGLGLLKRRSSHRP